ncbi:hypothetical protein F5X98DRAFT_358642 [Xylaria grammica]|nr:hypothetical protein F5X98DRAFT_358642 [Xylaria grammica]
MRLIFARRKGRYERYEMHEFFGYDTPKYAILSHTWGEEEVSFQDMQHLNKRTKKKQGFKKIVYTCDQAEHDGLSWVWIDTCCIDKSSSAELTEAINSMYGWYSGSATCYAYLVDVPLGDDQFAEQSAFRRSRWFTRGWTLQELIAPREVNFYNKEWRIIGPKHSIKSAEYPSGKRGSQESLGRLLESITGIPEECLEKYRSPSSYSVAKRMSWASKRQCTRVEDVAYSLMGIFGVNMPLLYGEGRRAFVRLQEEIMKETDDHSLFAWTVPEESNESLIISSVFAQSPAEFARSSNIIPVQEELGELSVVTRKGLKISLDLQLATVSRRYPERKTPEAFYATLNCAQAGDMTKRIALMLIPDISTNPNQPRSLYRCATTENIVLENNYGLQTPHTIYVYKNVPSGILQIFSPSFSKQSLPGHADSGLSMVRRLHYLASILASQRNYDKAEALCRQILYRLEKELGNDHPSTLVSLSNLASILQSLGKYKEAEALHRRALEGREMALAKDHLDTLTSLENLALSLQGLREYEEAETLHRQVLKRREGILGKNHWDTLTSLNNLASVLCDLGRHEDAEVFHRLASKGREIVLGRIHPDTLTSLNNLASVLSVLGNHEEAEKIRKRSNDIIESYDPYRREAVVSSIFNGIPPTTSTVLDGQTHLAPQTPRLYYPGLNISGNTTENGVYVRS